MKRWEYLTLTIVRTLNKNLVYYINDQEAREAIKTGPLGKRPDHPPLTQYLALAGQEGWEVAGVSPMEAAGGTIPVLVILKREAAQ